MNTTPLGITLRATGRAGPWTIQIDGWRPTLLNKMVGKNPHAVARRKESDCKVLWAWLYRAAVPRAHTKRRVTMTLVYSGGKFPDRDNCWKSLLDGLVNIGALIDDNDAWLEALPVQFERGPAATLLVLEDIS